MGSSHQTDLLSAIRALHTRGWALIPVPYRQKRPVLRDWQHLRLTADELANTFRALTNIGVLLGEPSGWLIDIDLDSPEALLLADHFLPSTPSRFGRTGTPEAHRLYCVSEPIGTTKFSDPLAHQGGDRGMLVELRSTGSQTLLPPSTHPSGEEIVWSSEGDLAEVRADALQQAVGRLAAATLLARHWPAPGSRHQTALALAGGLVRGGWSEAEVRAFVGAVAAAAGDEETDQRLSTVASTIEGVRQGRHVTGWPTVGAHIDAKVVQRVRSWLGLEPNDRDADHGAPDLADAELAPPVPFPINILPPILATFVQEGAAAFGIPADYIALPLLGFAAGLIGNRRGIQLKHGWVEFPILWVGVIGHPGSGKSPGMDYARRLVDHLQQAAWGAYQRDLAAYQEAQALGERGKSTDKPRLESFYTTDATLEAIASVLEASSGLSMIRDELVGWVQSHDAYRKAGDRQTWLSLWSASPLKIDRKTSPPLMIVAPCVSVIGGIQPDRLGDLRSDAGQRDGFVERLLLVWPESGPVRWTDAEVGPATIAAAQQLFSQLHRQRQPRIVVELDPVARDRFIRWHDENVASMEQSTGLAVSWAAKYPRQLARIALVLQAVHFPDEPTRPVTPEVVDGAIAVIEYLRAHLARVLVPLGQPGITSPGAGTVSRIWHLLREAGDGWLSRSELHAGLGRNTAADQLTAALATLEAEGHVERRTVPTDGRPREEWRLNAYERTKKALADPRLRQAVTPFFVSSFVRDESQADIERCVDCGAALVPGRRYRCEACTAAALRDNDTRFSGEAAS